MNSITSLPNETLFHCLHGAREPTVASIRNFGYNCRNLREACKGLQVKIDGIWNDFIKDYWELKDLPSIRSVIKWIDKRPIFTNHSFVEVLKADFGLDQTKKLLLGEAAKQHDSQIHPIIYKNHAFILDSLDHIPRLCHYTLEQESYSLKNTIPFLPSDPSCMTLIDDHIIIYADLEPGKSRLLAISLNDLIHSCSPVFIQSEILSHSTPQKMTSTLLIRSKKENQFCFQTVQIREGKIELNDLPAKGNTSFYETKFKNGYNCSSAQHIKDNYEVFQFYNYSSKPTYTFGSFSPTNVLSLVQFSQDHDAERQLIKFDDGLLSVYSQNRKIKIEAVNVVEGRVTFTPMPIKGLENEHFFLSTPYCHLDKLFLTGKIGEKCEHYFFVFNMKTQSLQTKHPINFERRHLDIIAADTGRLYLSSTISKKILEVLY